MRYFCIENIDEVENKTSKKYHIGIALSGGGARGFAHVGALKALEEVGIKPDILAGVSAGSIVSALYSAGISPEKIHDLFEGVKFNDLCELSVPKDGFFKLDKFKRFLRKNIAYNNIEELPIPTYICATDLDEGIPVAFDSGSIAERVIASCSIPIVFKPVKIGSHYYVDGGVLHNLPAWPLRDICEYVIGINCSPLVNTKMQHTIIDVAQRSFDLMARTNANSDMEKCDLVIQTVNIAQHNVFNLKDTNSVQKSGYKITKEIIENNIDLIERMKNR